MLRDGNLPNHLSVPMELVQKCMQFLNERDDVICLERIMDYFGVLGTWNASCFKAIFHVFILIINLIGFLKIRFKVWTLCCFQCNLLISINMENICACMFNDLEWNAIKKHKCLMSHFVTQVNMSICNNNIALSSQQGSHLMQG